MPTSQLSSTSEYREDSVRPTKTTAKPTRKLSSLEIAALALRDYYYEHGAVYNHGHDFDSFSVLVNKLADSLEAAGDFDRKRFINIVYSI